MPSPGVAVTIASARGRSASAIGPFTVATSAECTWCTVTSARGVATAMASATRARFRRTLSLWSDDPGPQFSPANIPKTPRRAG